MTWEGCHHKEKQWLVGGGSDHCQETEYREQGTILKGKEKKKKKRERREETYGRETKLINESYQQKESLVVLRFLGTCEHSASIGKLTGLSSKVLVSLAACFWSFGNRSRSSARHVQPQENR